MRVRSTHTRKKKSAIIEGSSVKKERKGGRNRIRGDKAQGRRAEDRLPPAAGVMIEKNVTYCK